VTVVVVVTVTIKFGDNKIISTKESGEIESTDVDQSHRYFKNAEAAFSRMGYRSTLDSFTCTCMYVHARI